MLVILLNSFEGVYTSVYSTARAAPEHPWEHRPDSQHTNHGLLADVYPHGGPLTSRGKVPFWPGLHSFGSAGVSFEGGMEGRRE